MIIRPTAKGMETPTTSAPSNAFLELGTKTDSRTPRTIAKIIATGKILSVIDKLDHALYNALSFENMIPVGAGGEFLPIN